MTLQPSPRKFAQDVVLDAVVVGDDVKAWRRVFYSDYFDGLVGALAYFPNVRAFGADYFGEVGAVHLGERAGLGDQLVGVALDRRDYAAHHAVVAEMAHQAAGVDVRQHGNFELLQILFGDLLRAPVGAYFRELADDQAFDVGRVASLSSELVP